MEFLASESSFANDRASRVVWQRLQEALGQTDGICYYKHPIIASTTRRPLELTLLARGFQPLAVRCISCTLDEISAIAGEFWTINGRRLESPVQQLEDYQIGLQHKFDKERRLRRVFEVTTVLALPLISKTAFEEKFGELDVSALWSDFDVRAVLNRTDHLDDARWLLAKSVFQGVNPLNKSVAGPPESEGTMGEAIRLLEREIALLDEEQHKVAIQIAPGPQRIRGLAGTGKTVVLAMKAANIHLRYPNKKILFTFNTQSLYNQAKYLITKFYRAQSDSDPDWEYLHVRHAWGGTSRPGVYFDACKRYGIQHLRYPDAARADRRHPFTACCRQLLKSAELQSYYDYVLVDEAQDFPPEFFQVLYRLASENKCIYWAYDAILTNWFRIDYQPGVEGRILHSPSHIHVGGLPRSRIMVQRVPTPKQFIEFLMATCYPDEYAKHRLNADGAYKSPGKIRSLHRRCVPVENPKARDLAVHLQVPG